MILQDVGVDNTTVFESDQRILPDRNLALCLLIYCKKEINNLFSYLLVSIPFSVFEKLKFYPSSVKSCSAFYQGNENFLPLSIKTLTIGIVWSLLKERFCDGYGRGKVGRRPRSTKH